MAYNATVFKVMIAFPSDAVQSRDIAREVINDWNNIHSKEKDVVLLPIDWKTHSAPELGGRPQSVINEKVLADCDLLVGIFHNRIGLATGKEVSGTVEEIKEHHEMGKPTMVYFSTESANPREIDTLQLDAVKDFEKWCQSNGLTHQFESKNKFREDFSRHLRLTINQHSYFKGILDRNNLAWFNERDPAEPKNELNSQASDLLSAASKSNNGIVIVHRNHAGLCINVGEKDFVTEKSPRSEAKWQAAIETLVDSGFLNDINGNGQIFRITSQGFAFVDENIGAQHDNRN